MNKKEVIKVSGANNLTSGQQFITKIQERQKVIY